MSEWTQSQVSHGHTCREPSRKRGRSSYKDENNPVRLTWDRVQQLPRSTPERRLSQWLWASPLCWRTPGRKLLECEVVPWEYLDPVPLSNHPRLRVPFRDRCPIVTDQQAMAHRWVLAQVPEGTHKQLLNSLLLSRATFRQVHLTPLICPH